MELLTNFRNKWGQIPAGSFQNNQVDSWVWCVKTRTKAKNTGCPEKLLLCSILEFVVK